MGERDISLLLVMCNHNPRYVLNYFGDLLTKCSPQLSLAQKNLTEPQQFNSGSADCVSASLPELPDLAEPGLGKYTLLDTRDKHRSIAKYPITNTPIVNDEKFGPEEKDSYL